MGMTAMRVSGDLVLRKSVNIERAVPTATSEYLEQMNPAQRIMLETSNRILYRRIHSSEDFEEVGDLRRRAFDARNIYETPFNAPVVEPLDHDPNTAVFGVYESSTLVATLRLTQLHKGFRKTPAVSLFRDTLMPLVDQGMTFVDPSRFAVDPVAARDLPGLPLLTLRLGYMATMHHEAKYCLCAVKLEHTSFYRKVFNATHLAGPLKPNGMMVQAVLLGAARSDYAEIAARYPIFNFTDRERRNLFDLEPGQLPPLTVKPTANVVLKAA